MKRHKLMKGNNIDLLKSLPDNSIDSVVTDPPYGISFMSKKWDYDVPSIEFWTEVYRVLKPGGHVLSFGGTRTYHRMVVNIEDAGFEIRDQIMWLYGSGFPKSHNIGIAIDKQAGLIGHRAKAFVVAGQGAQKDKDTGGDLPNPNTKVEPYKAQNEYEGWGTALKPANEPICLARKPLSEKSVAENVLKWKTGGINVDGCRVSTDDKLQKLINNGNKNIFDNSRKEPVSQGKKIELIDSGEGRFPANIILECICDEVIKGEKGEVTETEPRSYRGDSSIYIQKPNETIFTTKNYNDKGDIHTNPMCPCRLLDEQSGVSKSTPTKSHIRKGNVVADNRTAKAAGIFGDGNMLYGSNHNDSGGASRFFYQAKVSKAERNMGLDEFEEKETQQKGHGLDRVCMNEGCGVSMLKPELCNCEEPDWRPRPKKNNHCTVKPINLMTYLCRLITPENGIVLDPFMGSGSTGIAAQLEGFRFCGMEMDEDYFKIAEARIENYKLYEKFIK